MTSNYRQDSWEKGAQFENYVEHILFPSEYYELLYKTSDFKQNSERYVKASLKPDFQFKCLLTGFVFYVEAKYRTKPYLNEYELLSEQQFESFPSIQENESPVFVAFGYGGLASNPDYVSFFPLQKIINRKLSPELVVIYKIDKGLYPSKELQPFNKALNNERFNNNQEISKDKVEKEFVAPQKAKWKFHNIFYIIAAAVVFSLTVFLLTKPSISSQPIKDKLVKTLSTYYSSSDKSQIERLPNFLSKKNVNWYGQKDMTLGEIITAAKEYNKTYPYRISEVDWNSLIVVEDKKGYYASYTMLFKSKKTEEEQYTTYDLKLLTFWDSNLKLTSITESIQ
ncbi:hypothetical protein EAX61_09250 [Dokdonia sinensis]|uniref:Uncharacterized protein n=1 Tax=Dokdonia sinensis TaxID=2479847 RepID=A0A3M0G0P0_9FLAO|nr:hypothetical protein [Dokdonia sinensis]RMB58484.1 hypothetical protein EAX61_09250 [Dokdonia sinensis]